MREDASVMLSSLPPLSFTPEALVADEANNFSRNRIPPAPSSIDWEDDIIHLSYQPPLLHRAEEQSGLEILFPLPWKRDITGVQTAKLYPGISTISGILLCIEVSILACEDNRRGNYIAAQRVCGKASYTEVELMNMSRHAFGKRSLAT